MTYKPRAVEDDGLYVLKNLALAVQLLDEHGAKLSKQAQPRVAKYRVEAGSPDGDHHIRTPLFTKSQADSIGAVLHPDGLHMSDALRLVNEWNRVNRLQRSDYRYSILL